MEYLDEFGGENERGDEDDGDADSQHVMPSAPPPLPRSVHETAATMTTTTTTTAPTVRSKSAAAAAAAAAATAAAVVAAPRAKAAAAASAAASASAKPAPIERQIGIFDCLVNAIVVVSASLFLLFIHPRFVLFVRPHHKACGVARGRCKARPECDCPMYVVLLYRFLMRFVFRVFCLIH